MNTNLYTTFYIVRHGESDWNAQKLLQGHADIPLNKYGESQAQDLAKDYSIFTLIWFFHQIYFEPSARLRLLPRKIN